MDGPFFPCRQSWLTRRGTCRRGSRAGRSRSASGTGSLPCTPGCMQRTRGLFWTNGGRISRGKSPQHKDYVLPLRNVPTFTLWYNECCLVEDDLLPALDPHPGQLLEDVQRREGPAIHDESEFRGPSINDVHSEGGVLLQSRCGYEFSSLPGFRVK